MDLLNLYESSSDEDNGDTTNNINIEAEVTVATASSKKRKTGTVQIVSDRDASTDDTPSTATTTTTFVRSQPHVRGNWAGHIYAQLPAIDASITDTAVQTFCNDLQAAGWSGTLVQHANIHCSFSKQFYLQVASIDSFVNKLTASLHHCPAITVRCCVADPVVLVNDDKTRSFLTWPVKSTLAVRQLLQTVDRLLQSYNQPVYYDPPQFHFSLASIAGDATAVQLSGPTSTAESSWFAVEIDEIHCRFGGTRSYTIPLRVNP